MAQTTMHAMHSVTRSDERILIGIFTLIAATTLTFLVEPQIDMTFSALFYYGKSFPMAHYAGLQILRALNDWIAASILTVSMAMLFFAPLRKRAGVSRRNALIPILTYGLGAGILVNAILKETFGRARPRDIIEFGGDALFTKVWEISNACGSNCSFTSGEAAGAAAMFSVMFIMPKMTRAARLIVGGVIGLSVVALGLNRVAFGAHFLSDILLSVLLVFAVMLAARILLYRAANLLSQSQWISRVRPDSGFLDHGGEGIAAKPDGLEQHGFFRICLDLLPQPADVNINAPLDRSGKAGMGQR